MTHYICEECKQRSPFHTPSCSNKILKPSVLDKLLPLPGQEPELSLEEVQLRALRETLERVTLELAAEKKRNRGAANSLRLGLKRGFFRGDGEVRVVETIAQLRAPDGIIRSEAHEKQLLEVET